MRFIRQLPRSPFSDVHATSRVPSVSGLEWRYQKTRRCVVRMPAHHGRAHLFTELFSQRISSPGVAPRKKRKLPSEVREGRYEITLFSSCQTAHRIRFTCAGCGSSYTLGPFLLPSVSFVALLLMTLIRGAAGPIRQERILQCMRDKMV